MASALNSIGRDGAVDATIRNEIIPRLMLAFRELAERPEDEGPDLSDADAEFVALMALDGDEDAAAARLDALAAQGVGLDRLFLDVLAPAARRIGAAWETDERGFAEVSVALTRLHRLFRARQPDFEDDAEDGGLTPTALVAPFPGEHHVLGALIVEAFLSRAGWRVDAGRFDDVAALTDAVRRHPYDMVGLSIGRTAVIGDCRAAIARLRAESRNPGVIVMAGGEGVRRAGATAETLGVDAIAADARAAADLADALRDHARAMTAG